MYEIFEHTADLGIRVRAASFADLVADAGRGLTAVIAGEPGQIAPAVEETFTISGADPVWLLHDWVSELLAAFELRRMLFVEFSVAVADDGFMARARGERYDPGRHVLAHEVKAVTQHALDVHRTADGWEATFILDV